MTTKIARYEVAPWKAGWWVVIDHNDERPADDDGRFCWRSEAAAKSAAKKLNRREGRPGSLVAAERAAEKGRVTARSSVVRASGLHPGGAGSIPAARTNEGEAG